MVDSAGNTPLHAFASTTTDDYQLGQDGALLLQGGASELTRLIVAAGANPGTLNSAGKTALDLAKAQQRSNSASGCSSDRFVADLSTYYI